MNWVTDKADRIRVSNGLYEVRLHDVDIKNLEIDFKWTFLKLFLTRLENWSI